MANLGIWWIGAAAAFVVRVQLSGTLELWSGSPDLNDFRKPENHLALWLLSTHSGGVYDPAHS